MPSHLSPDAEVLPEPAVPGADLQPAPVPSPPAAAGREIGGPEGPEPTRFGDWEKSGRCIDF
jgi:hypothetical protein